MDNDFHIALAYQDPIINPDIVAGFDKDISSPGLKVQVESVPAMNFRAALVWLIPTAIVVYIAKPYFESFLREMGKDHYSVTKKALLNLHARIASRLGDRLRIFASKGKIDPDIHKYSPFFSIEAQSPFGYRVKLLIQTEMQPEHFNLSVEAFLRLMAEIHGLEERSTHTDSMLSNKPIGSMFLVSYNTESGELEYVNPIPEHKIV